MVDTPSSEPSMEEILASIRKIIADEKDPAAEQAAQPPEEEVLELTQMVQDDGSVVDLNPKPPEPEPEPAPEPLPEAEPPVASSEPEAEPEPMPLPEVPKMELPPEEPKEKEEPLLSDKVSSVASTTFSALANAVNVEKMAATMTPFGNGARTLEDMVMVLIKPMLKEWLDQNLPSIVERLVQKEVERISRRNQD